MPGQGIIGTGRSVCWVRVLLEQRDLYAGSGYYWNKEIYVLGLCIIGTAREERPVRTKDCGIG